MKILKLILAAIILTIVAQVIHTLGTIPTMSYYTNPNYFPVWSKIMMPSAGPPPASFMYYSFAFNFVGMFLFALVYSILKSAVPGKGIIGKGLLYGLLIFLVAGLPGSLAMILLINLPLALICMWAVEGLIINLVNGMIVAKINP